MRDKDDWSNKEMDAAVERAEAERDFALDNMANNEPGYVAMRLLQLHGDGRNPVPVKDGLGFGRLRVVDEKGNPGVKSVPSGIGGKGVLVHCRCEETGEIAEYHVESDGFNGVKVTSRVRRVG